MSVTSKGRVAPLLLLTCGKLRPEALDRQPPSGRIIPTSGVEYFRIPQQILVRKQDTA
jgi:hypothetical protein